jgi:hypothetical protein
MPLATISFSSLKRALVREVIHERVTIGITLLEVFIKLTYIARCDYCVSRMSSFSNLSLSLSHTRRTGRLIKATRFVADEEAGSPTSLLNAQLSSGSRKSYSETQTCDRLQNFALSGLSTELMRTNRAEKATWHQKAIAGYLGSGVDLVAMRLISASRRANRRLEFQLSPRSKTQEQAQNGQYQRVLDEHT